MSPEERAQKAMECAAGGYRAFPNTYASVVEAIRAAENDILDRAAEAIGGLVKPCADYCEHDYCVAVYDARSRVLALKSKEGER